MDSHQFKITTVGDANVGKSHLINMFCNDELGELQMTNSMVEFRQRFITMNNKTIVCQLWDTCGQERFRELSFSYYRGSDGILLMYDITNFRSFENVKRWLNVIRQNSQAPIILLGHKCDLEGERQVDKLLAQTFAKEHKIMFLETSILISHTIDSAVTCVLKQKY